MGDKIGTCLACSAPITKENGWLTSEASGIGHHNSEDGCVQAADEHIRNLRGLLSEAYELLKPVGPAWSGVAARQDWIDQFRTWQRSVQELNRVVKHG